MPLRSLAFLILIAVNTALASSKPVPWVEIQTPHFIIITDSTEKQGRHVASELERMRAVFHHYFPGARVDAASPIIVLAVRDKKDFQALEPQAYLAKGQVDLDGLFLRAPDKNYILLRLDVQGAHPYATVYHEYTHFITSRDEEFLPLWLNEGLAEFYQTTEIKDKEVCIGEPSVENVMLLRQNRLLPLATLFAVGHDSPYYHEENKASIFYAEAWALTHYLEFKDWHDHTTRLTQYQTLVGNNVDPVTAAANAFGDLKLLEKNLSNYIAQPAFSYVTTKGSTEVDEAAFKLEALTPTQADAVQADFLAYDQRVNDSRELLDRILRQDPNNVAAHETMGYLAFREGKQDEAAKWYEQAVKLDSQSFLAHYYFAMISSGAAPTAERMAQIESSLRAAIRLNPEFAPAFDQLAAFYTRHGKNLDEANRLSLKAIQLEPGNLYFRLNRASLLMAMRRPGDASAILGTAAKLATGPEQIAMLLREQEFIQQSQAQLNEYERRQREYREAASTSNSHPLPKTSSPPRSIRRTKNTDRAALPTAPSKTRIAPARLFFSEA